MTESTSPASDTLIWNFKLLGHHTLDGFGGMGEGMSMQLAKDGRRILWLAHESAPKNYTAVDVSDPRAPKIVARADLARRPPAVVRRWRLHPHERRCARFAADPPEGRPVLPVLGRQEPVEA